MVLTYLSDKAVSDLYAKYQKCSSRVKTLSKKKFKEISRKILGKL